MLSNYTKGFKALIVCLIICKLAIAETINVSGLVKDYEGDYKFTKAIQAAIIKASAQPNGQVIIDPYNGQYNLDVAPIKFYDSKIMNICNNLSSIYDLNCSHLTLGSDGFIDLKNITIVIECGITIEASTCYFDGLDEIFGFNGFKNFNIIGYGATLTMPGFEFYKTLQDVNHNNYSQYGSVLQTCENQLPDFCTTTGDPYQNRRNCRKEEANCLECWTGNFHPAAGPHVNFAQGRHGFHIANCQNVTIEGLTFKDIFSDGINLDAGLDTYYNWKHNRPVKDITIKNCYFKNCGRVGICFCTVDGATVSNCKFEDNGYLITGFDIDIEQFDVLHSALDIVIENCSFKGAANGAISISPDGITQTGSNGRVIQTANKKIDITINNCVISETEIGIHHAGGQYLPNELDAVKISNLTLTNIGHEYNTCEGLSSDRQQQCMDSLDNFARIGLLFDSRLTPQLIGNWSLWDVENMVMKELNSSTSGNRFTWNSMPVFIRVADFKDAYLFNRLGCAEDLTGCSSYSGTGFLYDELFGGISLKNVIVYDNHGNIMPDLRVATPIARQEFCLVKSNTLANSFFLPRFSNVYSQNIIKINPKNYLGNTNVLNVNSFECDLIPSTYNDDFSLFTTQVKPAVSVNRSAASINEGGTAYFKVSLSTHVNYPVAVDYNVKGSATNRIDYAYLPGTIIIPPNTLEVQIPIEIRADCTNEASQGETLNIVLKKDQDNTYDVQKRTASFKIYDLSCTSNLITSNCQEQDQDYQNEPVSEATEPTIINTTESEVVVNVKGADNASIPIETLPVEEPEEEENDNNNISSCAGNQIFTDFPWLPGIINQYDCNNEKIIVHSGSIYSFVLIETNQSAKLYFQDGFLFCTQTENYNCLEYYQEYYNLVETACWTCNASPCTISGCTDSEACNYNPNACASDGSCNYGNLTCNNPCNCNENNPTVTPSIFINNPILSDLVDLQNCLGTTIEVYDLGAYAFISITDNTGTKLYLDYFGSEPYCTDVVNYNCVQAYNLGTPNETWNCNGTSNKNDVAASSLKLKNELVNIHPNPNKGVFNISFSDISKMQKQPKSFEIYSTEGKLIYAQAINNNSVDINITHKSKGIYFVKIKYEDHWQTQKILIQ